MRILAIVFVGVLIAACSPRLPPPAPIDAMSRQSILHYDANRDGSITAAELETGLAAEFAAADTNHDGRLDEAEIVAVNDARWRNDAASTSPIQDWNLDGYVDVREFGAATRTLFGDLDRDGNGVVTPEELSLQAQPGAGRAGRGGGAAIAGIIDYPPP